ncbi:acyl-CoA thioesterase II [Pseudenhygromyxa sp. WMMC2535]|uniref:acyl-CoA thioesterase II n=1 Tax=Pseudenhygromyxa sp. WMMC2535 TaxID=2712867 RepID=UPI0015577515|nr:acyl-CoA thioesterase II [Pseudenhygromyxa sp. WMMC2535]NVB36853.1 acyl-CoA thioesterase II [Pseudenhygromyxa sp. WMMC2535]
MSQILNQLVELLALEQIEVNLFRGQSQDLGWGSVFGGQVLGQALSAAVQTVPPERAVHSVHGYFLRRGAVDRPIVYEVDRIRDGGSFTTRRVVAIQNGKAIFSLAASFQVEESGFEHQDDMPEVPPPESLLTQQEQVQRHADQIPAPFRAKFLAERPFEIRPLDSETDLIQVPSREPRRMFWIKANGELPKDPALHRYLLAYASDFSFLTTAMLPHGVTWLTPGVQIASLDHAMWFHQPFCVDQWLLNVVDSPNAHGGRGLVRGRIFTQDGRMVASTAQEGLIRMRAPAPQP